jgi:hypothetical protein
MQVHQLSYPTATFNPVLGKDLAERLRQMRPDARAVLAWGLTGARGVAHLTRAQASRLAMVPLYNIALASLATTEERLALMRGEIKMSDVRKAHAHKQNEVDAILNRYSADAIMAACDILTAPTLSVAAE